MSDTKNTVVRVTTAHNFKYKENEITTVVLVDGEGHLLGTARLETRPGLHLHERFENAIKLMTK